MKTILLAVLILGFAGAARAQEPQHAPTREQCTADANLWMTHIYDNPAYSQLTADTLNKMSMEMGRCFRDYHNVDFEILAGAFDGEVSNRMMKFLMRHHLYQQFYLEDQEGLREQRQ